MPIKQLPRQSLQEKRAIDYMMLLICPASVLLSLLVGAFVGAGDLVRLHAWYALIVELGLYYFSALRFVERHGGKRRYGLVHIGALEWLASLAAGAGLFFVLTAVSALIQPLLAYLGATDAALVSVPLPTDGGWRLIATLLLIAVIPAIAEETLFRGAMLHAWLPRGKKKAILHTALLYALMHFQPEYLIILIPVGILFALLTLRTGSCYGAVGMQIGNSTMAIFYAYFSAKPDGVWLSAITETTPGITYCLIAGLVIGGVGCCMMVYLAKKRHHHALRVASTFYKAMIEVLRGHPGMDSPAVQEEKRREDEQDTKMERTAQEQDVRAAATSGMLGMRGSALYAGAWAVILTYLFLGILNLMQILAMFFTTA